MAKWTPSIVQCAPDHQAGVALTAEAFEGVIAADHAAPADAGGGGNSPFNQRPASKVAFRHPTRSAAALGRPVPN
jgi:hypothetical protein